jgi:hypothetical protein
MCLSAWGRSARPQVEALRFHAGHRLSLRGHYDGLVGNRHTKKDNTCDTEGETTLTLFRNTVNTEKKNSDRSGAEGTAVAPNFIASDSG